MSKGKSSKPEQAKSEPGIKGLRNLGNTCFFNSICQNMVETRPLKLYLDQVKGNDGDVHKNLRDFMDSMWAQPKKSKDVHDPMRLLGSISSVNSTFKGRRQQDSHELLRTLIDAVRDQKEKKIRERKKEEVQQRVRTWNEDVVIDWLEDDCDLEVSKLDYQKAEVEPLNGKVLVKWMRAPTKSSIKKEIKRYKNVWQADNKKAKNAAHKSFMNGLRNLHSAHSKFYHDHEKIKMHASQNTEVFRPDSVVDFVYGGLLQSCVKCLYPDCGHKSTRNERFYDLSLPIEPSAKPRVSSWGRSTSRYSSRNKRNRNKRGRRSYAALAEEEPEEKTKEIDLSGLSLEEQEMHSEAKDIKSKPRGESRLKKGKLDLSDCLAAFTDPEILEGINAYGCEECTKRLHGGKIPGGDKKEESDGSDEDDFQVSSDEESDDKPKVPMVKRSATKCLKIHHAPNILTIHLKRFRQSGFRLSKSTKSVTFPLELNIAEYMSNDDAVDHPGDYEYTLYGVSVHSGGMGGGHYIAYTHKRRENGLKDGWYYFSDSSFHPVDVSQVLNCSGYILFYEKKDQMDLEGS